MTDRIATEASKKQRHARWASNLARSAMEARDMQFASYFQRYSARVYAEARALMGVNDEGTDR